MDVPLYKRKGYEKNYLGPAVYNSVKYGFHYREKVYAGIVAEKDSGEPFGALHNKQGYDYYSFYLLLHDIGILKTGIVGNYRLNFGQGLVLGQGSMFGKQLILRLSLSGVQVYADILLPTNIIISVGVA